MSIYFLSYMPMNKTTILLIVLPKSNPIKLFRHVISTNDVSSLAFYCLWERTRLKNKSFDRLVEVSADQFFIKIVVSPTQPCLSNKITLQTYQNQSFC
jgi:hypothetical protein